MADSGADTGNNEIIQNLLEGGLGALFEDKEISAYFKAGLKEAGCPPPFHIIVFTLLRKMSVLGWEFGGQALRTRLVGLLARSRRLSGWLDRIANICRACQDKNRLKAVMLAHLRDEQSTAPPPQIDDATEASVLAQLYTAKRFDAQDEALATLAETLQDILVERSGDAIAPHLGWAEGNDTTIADSIRYNSGLYDFEGRDAEINLLDQFCGDPSMAVPETRFSWLLLTGPGGEGKTRLALEYTTNRIGANWVAGRLSLPDLKQFRHGEWLPARPTFVVVDYPAQGPEYVHALLANLARRHRAFDWPVRVLLLEREAEGQWFDRVFPGSGDGAAIRAHAFVHEGQTLLQGLVVQPLFPHAIVAIMERRFHRAEIPIPGSALLLSAAARVDKRSAQTDQGPLPIPRPLFAAAVAEVMIAALQRGESVDFDWVRAFDREHVLAEIIKRDREMHWLPCVDGDRELLLRHENLLALATLSAGLKRADLRDLPDEIARLLPHPGEAGPKPFNEDLIGRMSGYQDGTVAPLEPDLLGEYFVLDRFARLGEVEGDQALRSMCTTAYEKGGLQAIGSALRTAFDFEDRVEELGWLFPERDADTDVIRRAAGLAIDLTNRFGLRARPVMDWLAADTENYDIALLETRAIVNLTSHATAARSWEVTESLLTRMDELRETFPLEVDIALEDAKATVNVTSGAGKADLPVAEAMLVRLDNLRASFPDESELPRDAARAAFNLCSNFAKEGEWLLVEAPLARIDVLRSDYPDDVEIALLEAQTAVNLTSHATNEGRWPWAEAMLQRIDQLRLSFPESTEIAREESSAAVNITTHAGSAGEWVRVDEALARLDTLREAFPDDVKVALDEAMAAFNVASASAQTAEMFRLDAMFGRIRKLREAFPEERDIFVREARALSNVGMSGMDKGDDALVARILTLARQVIGLKPEATSVPLLRMWCKSIVHDIDRKVDIDSARVDEIIELSMHVMNEAIDGGQEDLSKSIVILKYLYNNGHQSTIDPFKARLESLGLPWGDVPYLDLKGADGAA